MDETKKKYDSTHPQDKAGPLSSFLFWWTLDFFKKGYTRTLEIEDLYNPMKKDLSNVLGDRLEREWNRELEKSKHKTKEPNLLKAIGRVFVCDLIIQGFYNVFFFTFLRVIQPMIFGLLLRSLSSSNDLDRTEALSYNGLLVLVAIMSTASGAHTYHHALHAGLRIKVACSSLVYRKVLRLSTSILNESAMGMTMNLLSNDVSRFENAVLMLHTLWTSPICGLISLYLIWKETSFSGFIGFGVTMSFLPLLALCSRMGMKYRYQTTLRTDSRIKLMDEIICGIKVIKMYAWEKPYEALISIARRAEINYIIKGFYLRSITASSMNYLLRTSVYITIASMFYFGEEIPAHKIFTYYSLMNVAVFSLIYVFSQSISYVSDAVVSIRRLQDFLMQEEWSIYQPVATKESSTENNVSKQTIISLIGATASWNSGSPQNTLQNIDIQVEAGQLISVIGSVGSGKTSLLQVLLGELPLSKGTCFLKGKLSYACQDSWVFGSTIRQNIVFGSPFDQKRYDEVVAVCALLPDIEQFPQRDMTYIGERGITLSGGQKARINLARAIYKEADVYILDDPLSTVDTHVSKQLFEDCISSYLANKTRILVTHQLQYIKSSHNIILLKNGFIEMQGTFEYFQTCGVNYAQLLGVDLNNEPEETGEEEKENNESQNGPTEFMRALRKISKTSTSKHKLNRVSCERVENEEMSLSPPTDLKEGSSKGKITGSIYMQYLSSGSGYLVMIWMAITTLLLQFAISTTDYWMAYWVRQEELRDYRQMYDKMQNYTDNRSYILMDEETAESSYIMPANMCIYIYSALIISIYLFTIVHSVAFVSGVTRSNEALHNLMFKSVINTNPRFFDTNPSGRILNRFSKDVGSMDEQLFKSLFDTIQLLRNNFGSLILIAVVSYTSLVPTIGLLIGFYFLRKFYLRSSKNLKRLDGITKSPVFTHLQTTLRGLSTIRAYGAQNILKAEFDNYQDLQTSANFMFLSSGCAFIFYLDIMFLIYSTCVTYSFLIFGDALVTDVGLAITQVTALSMLCQWGMKQSTELSNNMMSVERILEYTRLEEEPLLASTPGKTPPEEWPKEGEIQLEHTFLKYAQNESYVLKDINITIKPNEKIGVVGRTGAGKSSLITALLRLAPVEGTVRIDGLDTKDIGLQDLRSRISTIPQDPILFLGTLRRNLDPFGRYQDCDLWRVLEDVELKELFHHCEGLDTKVTESGRNFSVGQRQLICLARAILRNNKIILLDEATANVDIKTDNLIQNTIRHKFMNCTVLTVAHRLNTIMDSNRVIVMSNGRVEEVDHPHILLRNTEGTFFKMVDKVGPSLSRQLAMVAEKNYNNRTNC